MMTKINQELSRQKTKVNHLTIGNYNNIEIFD